MTAQKCQKKLLAEILNIFSMPINQKSNQSRFSTFLILSDQMGRPCLSMASQRSLTVTVEKLC